MFEMVAFQSPLFVSRRSFSSLETSVRRSLIPAPVTLPSERQRQISLTLRAASLPIPYDSRFSRPNRNSKSYSYDGVPGTQKKRGLSRGASPQTESSGPAFSESDDGGRGGSDNRGGRGGGGGGGGGDGSEDGAGGESGGDGESERARLTRSLRLTVDESQRASMKELYSMDKASRIPLLGAWMLHWPALRNRLAANRHLPLQMGVEITVGVVTKTLAELQGRGDRFWKEFDFYLSDIALEIFGDAILVWLLSPVAMLGASHVGYLQRLPKHFGQVGSYGIGSRAVGFVYKGVQFGIAGFMSAVLGHGLTRWLVAQRDKKARQGDGGGEGDKKVGGDDSVELAPVLPTSLAWGGFLMTSSNARYQMVNGIEQRLLDPLFGGNATLLTALTFALRFGNCYVGGLQWLPWAKMWNIQ